MEVLVGEYRFRHEAEFAVGFLNDAEIPCRLQADDAGGVAGLGLNGAFRLWVPREAAKEAREILEVTPGGLVAERELELAAAAAGAELADAHGDLEEQAERDAAFARALAGADARALGEAPMRSVPEPASPVRSGGGGELCGVERVVAVGLGAGFVALATGFGGIAPGGTFGDLWSLTLGVVGAALFLSGVVGRSWGPLRAFLRAISGVAP